MQPNETQTPDHVPVELNQPVLIVDQPAGAAPQLSPEIVSVPTSPQAEVAIDEEYDGPAEFSEIQPINWQAQEYLQYDKSPIWYIIFGIVVCVFAGAALFLQAWTFAVLIPVMAVALVVYVHRPPHMINYTVSEKGLHINDILHPMGEFKIFSVVQSSNPQQNQLIFTPVKRFRPDLIILFPSEFGEEIVDTVGAYLPSQPYKPDAFDKIIQKLHI